VRWCTPVTPTLEGLRQQDHVFKTSLGYLANFVSKSKRQTKNKKGLEEIKRRIRRDVEERAQSFS
jgi:hypothetical protein